MEELQNQIEALEKEINAKVQEREALIEAYQVLQRKENGDEAVATNTVWDNPPKSVVDAQTRLNEEDRLSKPPTLRLPNSAPKKLSKDKFRELKTVDDLLTIFARVWPEAYQHKLKRLPGQLVKFDNPKYDYMVVPAHLNHVGVPLLGGKLRRNDKRLQDENDPFWSRFWHGVCNLLRTELLINQRFSIQEISRWENEKVEKGFFTLTIQVCVHLSPKERAQVARGIQFIKTSGRHFPDAEAIPEASEVAGNVAEAEPEEVEKKLVYREPIGSWADAVDSDED